MGIHSLTHVSRIIPMYSSAGGIFPGKVLVSTGLVHIK